MFNIEHLFYNFDRFDTSDVDKKDNEDALSRWPYCALECYGKCPDFKARWETWEKDQIIFGHPGWKYHHGRVLYASEVPWYILLFDDDVSVGLMQGARRCFWLKTLLTDLRF